MPATGAVQLKGMPELLRALSKADRNTRLGVRKEMRDIAQPVASDAEQLARQQIRNIGERWPRMRVGLTRTLLYVAPRERGVKGRSPRRRPNLADLLAERAMEPAAATHQPGFEAALERALDRIADQFNRGGPL